LANQGQLLSQISGYEETEFDTLIPQINTTADIVEAFKQYHYGYADFNGTVNPSPNSIHSHLLNIDTRLTTQENTPTGGGIVQNDIPHLVIRTDNSKTTVPEGYIWLDHNGETENLQSAGVVTLSANEPSTPIHGQVWVDRDYSLTSFNASLFATQSAFDILENTVTQLSIRLDGVEALALGL
jgi:hypothetical protein